MGPRGMGPQGMCLPGMFPGRFGGPDNFMMNPLLLQQQAMATGGLMPFGGPNGFMGPRGPIIHPMGQPLGGFGSRPNFGSGMGPMTPPRFQQGQGQGLLPTPPPLPNSAPSPKNRNPSSQGTGGMSTAISANSSASGPNSSAQARSNQAFASGPDSNAQARSNQAALSHNKDEEPMSQKQDPVGEQAKSKEPEPGPSNSQPGQSSSIMSGAGPNERSRAESGPSGTSKGPSEAETRERKEVMDETNKVQQQQRQFDTMFANWEKSFEEFKFKNENNMHLVSTECYRLIHKFHYTFHFRPMCNVKSTRWTA